MPDEYGFDHLPNHGEVTVCCIHCSLKGESWRIPAKVRQEHSKRHVVQTILADSGSVDYAINQNGLRVQNCRVCGDPFTQERRRGRPRLECFTCKPEKES